MTTTLAYRLDCQNQYEVGLYGAVNDGVNQDTDVCVYTRTQMTTTLAEGEFVSMAKALVAAEDAGADLGVDLVLVMALITQSCIVYEERSDVGNHRCLKIMRSIVSTELIDLGRHL